MKNSTKNKRFTCVPASGGAILTSAPPRTLDKIVGYNTNPSTAVTRRLSQPLHGVPSERFSGMLPILGGENALDFLQEQRSGFMEKHMSEALASEFGAGPKTTPAHHPRPSPLQRIKQKMNIFSPKR